MSLYDTNTMDLYLCLTQPVQVLFTSCHAEVMESIDVFLSKTSFETRSPIVV